jgi:hydroxymethylpyrimidine pyrophosphatase-like HAD family hydrolase
MRYLALCCDYDGTIAHHGRVSDATIAALENLRASGRSLLLVTGRELDDLEKVFPRLDLFDRVVAENGALIFRPKTREEKLLGERPTQRFIDALLARKVGPISVGRVIVATWEPHETAVLEVIREQGLELQVIFNKGAVMILPAGVNKATGLVAALDELNMSPHNAVGVGDAENDHAFLSICECAVAVCNALPSLKEKADFVTALGHGEGVTQLVAEMLEDDLRSREPLLARHNILLGKDRDERSVDLPPYNVKALLAGTSGGGKSTVAMGLTERLHAAGYGFCVVDPEGDYDGLDDAVVLGGPDHVPGIDECIQLLQKPRTNLVINLLGIKLNDRPKFFTGLMARIHELRSRTGRPHWVIADEAHHLMPADAEPTMLPERLRGVFLITVNPRAVSAAALRDMDTLIAIGEKPKTLLDEFTAMQGHAPLEIAAEPLPAGAALVWRRNVDAQPLYVQLEPSRGEHRRHVRKYAEGELPPDRSFYFRGPDGKLNLRARNLILFLELAEGVDEDTWLFHLRQGDYSRWIRKEVKDDELAQCIVAVEQGDDDDPEASRQQIRRCIEAKYTLPAQATPAPGARDA